MPVQKIITTQVEITNEMRTVVRTVDATADHLGSHLPQLSNFDFEFTGTLSSVVSIASPL